ncbi:MAG: DUF3732 domain-containing protein [Dehalobacter sp. 4CP]|uniref:DUF3732 domain-containing protein n=1 Tax=Dehalobacter sp. CP TaxID=2594474 RepID=UPI0013CD293F|nr:DUF3732 domain-containing protein [Dehalobacter sp. 4CP]
MNFYIDKLLLWLKDGNLRTLQFVNDKVNVITGNSKTGKTAVLEIVDYCFCGSNETVVISHEHIGENVAWYGLRFTINDKVYTIARGAISENGKFSPDYYFSQMGEIPEIPYAKLEEDQIKSVLEQEFSIDDNVTIAYGGRSVRKNTRLSFRYFQIFNTLSKDIIANGKMFFDKMTLERYRDVWPQIFDLAFGVIDIDSIATQKKINELQQEISVLEADKKKLGKKAEHTNEKLQLLIKQAKENGLLDEALPFEKAVGHLEQLIADGASRFSSNFSTEQEYEKLENERSKIALQLTKLRRFKRSYNKYKDSLRDDEDALRPITYLQENFSANVQGEYRQFLNILAKELSNVRKAIHEKRPFELDIERRIRELTARLAAFDDQLSRTAHVDYVLIPTAQKLVSLGEIKAEYKQLDLSPLDLSQIDKSIGEKSKELELLEVMYSGTEDRRTLIIDTLNEYIQTYISSAKVALDEYGEFSAWFDYKNQRLTLKKSKSAITAKISSSSDHLYLHLCLFAGMHHMLLSENSLYIPSFIIIDQPSIPYFNNSEYDYKESEDKLSNKSDWAKVKNIFKLWNDFYTLILKQKKHFQVIMLEHVSENAWVDCEHIHLVEIFDGIDNALIPFVKQETK